MKSAPKSPDCGSFFLNSCSSPIHLPSPQPSIEAYFPSYFLCWTVGNDPSLKYLVTVSNWPTTETFPLHTCMAYGRNLPWRAALQGRLRTTTRTTTGGVARCYSGVSARRGSFSLLEAQRLGPSHGFVATATSTTTKQLWEGFGNAALRRGFANSAARLKEQPPRKDEDLEEKKDAVEEEVEEEVKRKPKKEGDVKVDSGKERSGEGSPSPGEVLKGGAGAGGKGGANGGENGSANGGGGGRKRGTSDRALQKPTVPDIYPQVMALPIAGRPLFPGFYKAVTVRDPAVAAAIQEMMKRGQPYIGAFLFKEENADRDTIDSLDEVHDVGVFAQITSAFPVHGEEGSLTAVLYPHRRIKISQLLPRETQAEEARDDVPEPIEAEELTETENKGDVVASFEEEAVEKKPSAAAAGVHNPYATAFLKKYKVSIVDVENLVEQPYDKKNPVIRAVTSEIVNVFKEVANLNPLFRDQISTFSMSQSAGNVIDEPAKLADFAAAVSAGEFKELQDVLETLTVEDRLQKALVVLKKELMNAQLQSKISKDVEAKIQKRQREYWLMEQMKGIRRELGIESDGKDKLVEKFKEKADKLVMPEAVRKVFDEVRPFLLYS